MNSINLLAYPGDNILGKYRELTKWIEAQKIQSSDSLIQITQKVQGQDAYYIGQTPHVVTPLLVSQSGPNGFSVGEGYVNGRLPLIQPIIGDEQPLVNADGVRHSSAKLPETRPILVVAEVKFDANLAMQSVKIVTKKPAELLKTGTANYASTGTGSITGHIPLAFNRGSRFIQFVRHNIQVKAYVDSGVRRIIYWPA